jgi:hypothetical protein
LCKIRTTSTSCRSRNLKSYSCRYCKHFKDGYVLGIAHIGGHVAGSFLGPIAVEAGMAKAAGTIAKIRGLGTPTFTELEEINLARTLSQQEFQDEFAHAEQLLQEAAEKGQVAYAVTPDGLKIPVKMEGEIAAEQAVIARMEGEVPKAGGLGKDAASVKVKNPEQVVAEYDRYIQTMRLKLDKLEKYF